MQLMLSSFYNCFYLGLFEGLKQVYNNGKLFDILRFVAAWRTRNGQINCKSKRTIVRVKVGYF